ncbi:flavin oxidoreductase [Streptococcus infantarius subsp. infantarius]|nr:flavin oxidoreductase [Streptococcus infantarius subsp. infantarius]MCO4527452.1 flavin oxidoreductase [Streptococcus infantarius subsp. infantarius]
MKLVAIVGTNAKHSYNRLLLKYMAKHLTKPLKIIPQRSLYFTAIEGFNIPIRTFKKS